MERGHGIAFAEARRVWVAVALQSFGGPAGQIAVMHRILVDEKRWIGEARFLHALNYCMLLPGPEAQQLATYIGWLLHGTRGGLLAGGLFILPGFLSILVLSVLYAGFRDVGWVDGMLFGLKAAVLAVVIEAVVRIGRRVLVNPWRIALAAAAFVALFFFAVPFPVVLLGAALVGVLAPVAFSGVSSSTLPSDAALDLVLDGRAVARPSLRSTAAVVAAWGTLWLGPLVVLVATLGPDHVFVRVGSFFGFVATVTFGGAYSVLAYVAQEAVEQHGWLTAAEMLDGLGLAETTPGPLIQVVQFVGFLATFREPGTLHPMVAGALGSVLTSWVTFTPCFLWIFAGAPYVEWLRGHRGLAAALTAITAAVVGVILNLAVWFSIHVLFATIATVDGPGGLRLLVPDASTFDPIAGAIAVTALIAMLRFKVGMIPTLLASAVVGLVVRLGGLHG